MNNTLLHHFDSIHDEKYIALKEKVISNITLCNDSLDKIEVFKTVEQTAEILDYLTTYIRNIIRMGFSSNEINLELNVLYDYDEENQKILNELIPKLKKAFELGTTDALKEYNFYFERIMTEHSVNNTPNLSDYKDIEFVLEQYQSIISKQVNNKESIADLFLLYQVSNESSRNDKHDSLLKAIRSTEENVSSIFWLIKHYQNDLSLSYGFNNPLGYIAEKYCISYQTVEYMLAQTKGYKQSISAFKNRSNEFGFNQNNLISQIMNPPKLNILSFSFEEAMDLLEMCFMTLDSDFGKMIHIAKIESWVDWEKRYGKLNGSYTNVIPFCKKSIISMTFDGSISDVCKLAHELGHAFHGMCVSEHSFYNTDFSVITAEMFGLFCENYAMLFIAKHFMEPSKEKQWKKDFFFNALKAYFVNLIAFHFEKESFDSIQTACVSPTEIYKDVLIRLGVKQDDDVQEYEWMFRSQNFFPDYFYYNFVYVIGEAVSLSVIDMLIKDTIDFKMIRTMLTQSGVNNVDNLFGMINQDLHSQSIYDIIGTLDQVWKNFRL